MLSFIAPAKATSLAYKLFSNPRIGRLKQDALPEILASAEKQRFDYSGTMVQSYVWQGNDNVILLVHGWESNASRWSQLIPYLRESGSTVIAIDAPAHGLSDGIEFNVPQYAEFINVAAKNYNPQHIIGHSIGGAACVYCQSKHQNSKLRKMVLLGAPSDLTTLVRNYVKLLGLSGRMFAFLEQYFIDNFKFRLEEFSAGIFGKSLKLEGMVAHDAEDTVVLIGEAYKIRESWAGATFIETKGLGHSMHDEDLYRKIAAFVMPVDR